MQPSTGTHRRPEGDAGVLQRCPATRARGGGTTRRSPFVLFLKLTTILPCGTVSSLNGSVYFTSLRRMSTIAQPPATIEPMAR